MAPRLSRSTSDDNHTTNNNSMEKEASVSRASSQAEAVATQLEASTNGTPSQNGTASDNDYHVPSTPPPMPKPEQAVRQDSALKRLGQRLRGRFIDAHQRRSLSAPPALRRRRNRTQLLEEHFVVEKVVGDDQHASQNKVVPVVLPGVPKQEDNWARDLHDFFNLIVLVPVVILNIMNWDWDTLLGDFSSNGNSQYHHHHHNRHRHKHNHRNNNNNQEWESLGDAWTGEYFEIFFYVVFLYFVVDMVWVALVPRCVRSPSVIIQHHMATLLYIFIPYLVPHVQWCMGACMSVEVNTWLLIARRVSNKQGFSPWNIDVSFLSLRVKLISIFFYITWIGIRCILYPYLLRDIWRLYMEYSLETKTYWNLLLVCFPLHAVFCALNLKWSYDLLLSKLRYWRRRRRGLYGSGAGGEDDGDNAKDKGL